MKRAYYRAMERFTHDVAWFLFWMDPTNYRSGGWLEASEYYSRKLSMMDHPSNG